MPLEVRNCYLLLHNILVTAWNVTYITDHSSGEENKGRAAQLSTNGWAWSEGKVRAEFLAALSLPSFMLRSSKHFIAAFSQWPRAEG